MKKAGCEIITLVIKFGNENIRKLARRKLSAEQSRRTLSIINDAEIDTYGLFIIGYPTETEFTI